MLEVRLARIFGERWLEIHAIESRHSNFDDRTFPVAVIFVVPEGSVR